MYIYYKTKRPDVQTFTSGVQRANFQRTKQRIK